MQTDGDSCHERSLSHASAFHCRHVCGTCSARRGWSAELCIRPLLLGSSRIPIHAYRTHQVLTARHTSLPDGTPARRSDRIFDEDGTVVRIHQEDLCQALSIDPSRKYAEQGGPSSPDVLSLLSTTNANAPRNLQLFVLYLLFNYLMGATDAHAKNYSVLLGTGDTTLLAPLYDIASIAPYQSLSPRRRKPLRAAMSIGGENRFGLLSGRHLERLSRDANLITAGITREWIASAAERMATEIPSALQVVLNSASKAHLAGIEQVGPALMREISANCRRFLEQL